MEDLKDILFFFLFKWIERDERDGAVGRLSGVISRPVEPGGEWKNKTQKKKEPQNSFFLLSSFGCKFHFITYLQTRVLIVSDFSPVTRVCCPAGEYGRKRKILDMTKHKHFTQIFKRVHTKSLMKKSCRSSTRIYSEILKDPLNFAGKKYKKAKTNFCIYKQCVVVCVCVLANASDCLTLSACCVSLFFPLNLIHLIHQRGNHYR